MSEESLLLFQRSASVCRSVFRIYDRGSPTLREAEHLRLIRQPSIIFDIACLLTLRIIRPEFFFWYPASANCLVRIKDLELKVGWGLIGSREATALVHFDSLEIAVINAIRSWDYISCVIKSVKNLSSVLPLHINCSGIVVGNFWSAVTAVLVADFVYILGILTRADSEYLRSYTWFSIAGLTTLVHLDASTIRLAGKVFTLKATPIEYFGDAVL